MMELKDELTKLPRAERLRCMEALWESLSSDECESPARHGEVLSKRRQAVADQSWRRTLTAKLNLLGSTN